jgi:glycosyltransferase involved in cell wall biosynthesis
MNKTVAIVCSDITQLGGIERAVCTLSESLIGFGGYRVVIISVNSAGGAPVYGVPREAVLVHLGIKNRPGLLSRALLYPGMVKRIAGVCGDCGVGVVIGTDTRLNVLLCFVGGGKLIKIACEHNVYGRATPYTSLARRLTYAGLDAVVLLTRRDAARYGFCGNAAVIPNAAPFAVKRLSSLKHNVVISAGRMEKVKGFDILIEAVSLIRDECVGWKFKVFGDGSEKERLIALAGEKGLEGLVEILPSAGDIESEYRNSSIYALPSRTESFGLVLLEAMSCGLPVAAFDCPHGPAEIVRDGIDGLLAENGSAAALAQALLKLIKAPRLRERYGRAAAKRAAAFVPERVFEMWEKLFDKLAKERRTCFR